jgi:hypothetical protein
MRKKIVMLFIFAFVLSNIGMLLSQQNPEDEKFKKALDSYFDDFWKFYPTEGTLIGYHNYDNKLEDFGSKSIDKRHDALDKFNQEFVTKIDKMKLSPEFQIDHELILNSLESELIRHENLIPWEYNPIFYNHIFAHSIRSLVKGDFAPQGTRAKNAADRLKSLPKLIKQAKENLKTPAELYTQAAIKQFPTILSFYKSELASWIDQAPGDSKAKLQSELAKVIPAMEDYQNFLQNELLTRSTGQFRLLEAHARLMRINLLNNIPLQELIARAQADYKNIRRDMFLVSIPFYKIMDPKFDIERPPANLTEDQLINTAVTHVLDRIKVNHVSNDEFFEKVKSLSGEIKEFLTEKDLVELPDEALNIEPMPLDHQNNSRVVLSSPSPYAASGSYTCLISSFPDDLENDKLEALLGEYNNFLLPFWTLRNVYPGSFVPSYFTQSEPSLIKKMYPNKPLVKGWASLLEEKLIKSGYGNYDLSLRLNQLKYQLRTVIDFIVEFNVHEGSWTKEDAVAYMTRGGFRTQADAEAKWDEIILNPGEAAYVYVGMQELLDMEKDYKQLKGDSFSQKEFLRDVLRFGHLPLRHLKRKLLEQ